ncbi:Conserved oligomeric Golgi complex subunit 5 [Fulvia fulva]|uniref:Conserved oligomeric Golgi complex subunit 5 n=1 Tax=Passalora fulva TaxID=5499 RepID=A0A9Q8PJM7_PASFU|nr:Conserved oligomeric Golgi complex subunit 5 [Fulvia fulva]KAK4611733.1 Conserved oligomeric Golgi complex subunit 5 [Fulvia fulva]KAK4612800.1 Conserved oligomeric Golgi complex subunit 5 [Fulvia fulva]UJO23715.1 Conserved oligomeric Golgi complex subunit 5 [Fulvia fulva]WPV21167.1 Conserved oligomeric Golgi complex subunit 5 [Fulvia fulva]WPV36177.1 Conserved oligomeric Golgi complex subunit 5 [Fulvia fulva]
MADTSSPYLDTAAFLSDDFNPSAYANKLVLDTNNPTDTPLDLSTPLSKVLFDVQEVDTHIDTLTTQNALPIVSHARERNDAATRVLETVEEQVNTLSESYKRLEREVGERYEAAEQVRLAAENMVKTLRLGRAVQRVVQLGRRLEEEMDMVSSPASKERVSGHRAMVPAARTVLELRSVFTGEEGSEVGRVNAAQSVRQDLGTPSERSLITRAQGVVREFSMSSLLNAGGNEKTFAQAEETKERAKSAMQTLWLLSPMKKDTTVVTFDPSLLLQALQSYLQTAITSSVAAIARALATLPTLDRALLETSARCQNIIALESLLENIKPPTHPLLQSSTSTNTTIDQNFLQPLLRHLDTSSLPSFFWRSMASQMTSRVQEFMSRGGVSARTLRTNKDRVRDAIREGVDRGYRGTRDKGGKTQASWEREAAVMVSSVVGPLGR